MAFTYDASDLATPLNRLRFLVQDTVDTGHFFEDEEIEFAAEQESNIYRVAADLCRTIAAKLSKTPSQDDATIKFEAEKQAQNFLKIAEKYDAKADETDTSLNAGESTGLSLPTVSSADPAFTRSLGFE